MGTGELGRWCSFRQVQIQGQDRTSANLEELLSMTLQRDWHARWRNKTQACCPHGDQFSRCPICMHSGGLKDVVEDFGLQRSPTLSVEFDFVATTPPPKGTEPLPDDAFEGLLRRTSLGTSGSSVVDVHGRILEQFKHYTEVRGGDSRYLLDHQKSLESVEDQEAYEAAMPGISNFFARKKSVTVAKPTPQDPNATTQKIRRARRNSVMSTRRASAFAPQTWTRDRVIEWLQQNSNVEVDEQDAGLDQLVKDQVEGLNSLLLRNLDPTSDEKTPVRVVRHPPSPHAECLTPLILHDGTSGPRPVRTRLVRCIRESSLISTRDAEPFPREHYLAG